MARRISTMIALCCCILVLQSSVTDAITPVKPTTKPVAKPPTVKPVVVAPTSKPVSKPIAKPIASTLKPVSKPTTKPIAPAPTPIVPTPKPVIPTPKPIVPTPKPIAPTSKPAVVIPTNAPTTALTSVAKKIAQYAPGSVNAFVPGSYQAKALAYVQSLPNASSLSSAKAVQFYALACIYYATNGVKNPAILAFKPPVTSPPEWLVKTNWLSTTVDPCTGLWHGVTCVNNRVTRFDLSNNRLTGGIPYEITLLSADNPSGAGSINYLDLYNNQFLFNDGDIGGLDWIGGLGSNMQKLYFGSTSMYSTKGVPDFLSNLTNLVEFDCSFTLIRGALRNAAFSKLTKLQYIELDGNGYNSTIPSVFATLPNLLYFYASTSFLSGDLSFMKGMPKIHELWVDQSNLKGTLPSFLGSLSTLASFSVSRNSLSGSFPTQLAQLTDMQQMWYYSNKLSGNFPDFLVSMKTLAKVRLENNNFVGNVGTLCSALGPPFGALTSLGVDCTTGGKVTCPSSCKICCCTLALCGDNQS